MDTYSAVITTTYPDGSIENHTMYYKEMNQSSAESYAEQMTEWRSEGGDKLVEFSCVCVADPALYPKKGWL